MGVERCWGHLAWSTAVRRLSHSQAQGCGHPQWGTRHRASSLEGTIEQDSAEMRRAICRLGMLRFCKCSRLSPVH